MSVTNLTFAQGIKSLFSHLAPRRRWQLLLLVGLMFVGAFAELVSLSAVVPFVTVLAAPERLSHNVFIQNAMAASGISVSQLPFVISLTFAALIITAALVRLILLKASTEFSYGIGHDLGCSLFSKTLQRPYNFHVSRNTSEIIGAVNKVQDVVGAYIVPLINGFIALILAGSIIFTLIAIDPLVALGGACVFGLSYFVIALSIRKRLRSVGAVIALSNNQRVQAIQEGLGAIRDVILDRAHIAYQQKFTRMDGQLRRAQITSQVYGKAPRMLIEAVGMLLLAGFALAYSATKTDLAALLPVLGALAIGAQKLMPLVQQIYTGWSSVISTQATLQDVLDLLDYEPVVPHDRVISFAESIQFKNVYFAYSVQPDSVPVLENITLTIFKGEKIGIIGTTGSGKSTLLDLLMGLLSADKGQFVIDDQVITERNVHAWQKRISHVPQNVFLSDASIAENIAFSADVAQVDQHRLEQAARIAQIHDHVMSLPQAYRTPVGERGVRLSGGQRQRIGIARALYKRADVLVLDEATSALDDSTESYVINGIEQLASDLTVIMIAHRLTTLKNCDRIVELRNGRIANLLTYDELMKRRLRHT